MSRRDMEEITFTCPLPPVSLRANSRAHWSRKKRDADEYSETVEIGWWVSNLVPSGWRPPWKKAHVLYEWRYAGVGPDHGNLGGNTKYLQDIICMAPKNAKPGYKRWHLGLVEDDKGITAEYEAVKVKTKREECVRVTVRREDGLIAAQPVGAAEQRPPGGRKEAP